MKWFKRKTKAECPDFMIGDEVWISTFVKAYKGTIVAKGAKDVMSSGDRFIVMVDGEPLVVNRSFLTEANKNKGSE